MNKGATDGQYQAIGPLQQSQMDKVWLHLNHFVAASGLMNVIFLTMSMVMVVVAVQGAHLWLFLATDSLTALVWTLLTAHNLPLHPHLQLCCLGNCVSCGRLHLPGMFSKALG